MKFKVLIFKGCVVNIKNIMPHRYLSIELFRK